MTKRSFFRLIISILIVIISFCTINFISSPANAASCGGVETSIIECGDEESGIGAILKTVINVMSIGIGILAVIGITVVGIQYLTAGANEEQVRKSKRRLIEIVIGIIAYILLYALLQWLIPGSTDPDDIPYFEPVETPTIDYDNYYSDTSNGDSSNDGNSNSTAQKCADVKKGKTWIAIRNGAYDSNTRIEGYYLYVPQSADEKTPIMIYLHGGSEAELDYDYSQLPNLYPVNKLFNSSQFISIVPHAIMTEENAYDEWVESEVKSLVQGSGIGANISQKLESCGGISNRDKYIMGMSDGANMTFAIVQNNPKLFKAAAPIAGPGYISNGKNFNYTRIVGIIGDQDTDIRINGIKSSIDTIKKNNPSMNPILVIYEGKNHGNITSAIDYPTLFGCLLNGGKACDSFGNKTKIYKGN